MTLYNPPRGSKVTNGSYTGDSSNGRPIPHGLGTIPKLVLIISDSVAADRCVNPGSSGHVFSFFTDLKDTVTASSATNFYVDGNGGVSPDTNENTVPYLWFALGDLI